MADYIRREDALKALQNPELFNVTPRLLQIIREMPAADVAEVVRCKDCRYLGRELDKGLYSCDDYNLPYCEPDSYCSHGRRKEETKHAAD